MMSDPPVMDYSADECQDILAKTILLLKKRVTASQDTHLLHYLIEKHFQDIDHGNEFRSLCCFGSKRVAIYVELFNSLCILPATNWDVCLSANRSTAAIEACLMDISFQENVLLDFFSTARNNIVTIVDALLRTHLQGDLIRSFIPRQGIPSRWTGSILGIETLETKTVLPPTHILSERVSRCLQVSLERKALHSALHFFQRRVVPCGIPLSAIPSMSTSFILRNARSSHTIWRLWS
jgi:hypothetical protein